MGKNNFDLSKNLQLQVDQFIQSLEEYNNKRPAERKRQQRDYEFLKDLFIRFLSDRNNRAIEVQSPEYEKVKTLANEQFPTPTLWNLCMDGRVKSVVINGMTAGVGATIRVPGGILREFVRDTKGNFTLLRNSNFAQLLINALSWDHNKIVTEVFDSHVGCAARNAEEHARGRDLKDMGLLSDVLHKKEMLEALHKFTKSLYGDTKRVISIQTSFDPHCGYLYMGLETDEALRVAKDYAKTLGETEGKTHRWEYTTGVLKYLVEKGKVIFTEEMVEIPQIKQAFDSSVITLNWETGYVQTAKQFWNNIARMKEKLLPLFREKLITVYPYLKEETKENQIELEERAMILLTNAYSGYLNNHNQEYPYGVHREECIKVSKGGFPPYEISAFVVLSTDESNLSSNIELAASLVRQNRMQSRVSDRSGSYLEPDEFAQAPVPLIIQEILDEELNASDWENLCSIGWEDMPEDWDVISDREFLSYLETKGDIHLRVAIGMNDLRHKMAILFDSNQIISGRLISHHKVALPVMVDKNRINYLIIPFIKHGFLAN